MEYEKRDTGAAEVAREIIDEVSKAIAVPPGHPNGLRVWHLIGSALAGILVAGTIAMALGRAFFVERTEYNMQREVNAVEHESLRQILSRLDRTLTDQTAAFRELQKTVQSQAVDIAVVRRNR